MSLRRDRQHWLLAVAAGALAATFLRPSIPVTRAEHEFIVVLDITQSMNVPDYRLDKQAVSRLEFAKQALRQTLPALPCGTKLGWGIFTEYRTLLLFTPVEVCANQRELLSSLEQIGGRMAWSGNSEVAKGLYGAIAIAKGLPSGPGVVFVTDGHEAPPLNPLHRPAFNGKPGEVRGMIVGAGGNTPAPIPKIDPDGKPLGFWKADEVMQSDAYSGGREGSLAGERLVETETVAPSPPAFPKFAGGEHLSSRHEAYLQLLAAETGLGYHALDDASSLTSALLDQRLARAAEGSFDLRPLLGVLALAALVMTSIPSRRESYDEVGQLPDR